MASRQLDEEAIFHVARAIPTRDARSAYLDQICVGDQALRERVEALLAVHEQEQDFLRSSPEPAPTIDQPRISEGPGHQIGRYKLLQKIGEGGFGVVYMAEQVRPVRRKVALKIIKPGMDTRAVVARFEAERQALALMDHPNVAHVLDAGETESGRPFFVMELVKGVPITEYCDRNEISTEDRLALFIDVCHAVQHAHQKGIIHRDIKPANIMVTLHDGRPVPKVIDFGVSKAISQQLTERTLFTRYGQMIGTPLYMSPEQAEMSGLDVDTRTDIYALGVLLYELLTGSTPFDKQRLGKAAYDEIRRIIREEEPPRPSVRLSASGERLTVLAKHRACSPTRLQQLIRGELDWVVMKSLEKERERRYYTAAELAADVKRYLVHEPVEACPPSATYRVRKFVGRNKLVVGAAAAVALSLVLGLVGTTIGFISRSREAEKRRVALEGAKTARTHAEIEEGKAREATALARQEAKRSRQLLYVADMNAAQQAWEEANVSRVVKILLRHTPAPGGDDLRGFEWYYLWKLCDRCQNARRIDFPGYVKSLAFSPDGRVLAVRGDEELRIYDADTLEFALSLETVTPDWVGKTYVRFSPDGQTIAYPVENKVIALWNRTTKKAVDLKGHENLVTDVAFAPDGKTLASIDTGNSAVIWDLESLRRVRVLEGDPNPAMCVAFSPDGRCLASGGADNSVVLWDPTTGTSLAACVGHTGSVSSVTFSPRDKLVASGGYDGKIMLWDSRTGKHIVTLDGHSHNVRAVAFSPDGSMLASSSGDGTVRIWDVTTNQLRDTLPGHSSIVMDVAFSPSGMILASGGDAKVMLWEVTRRETTETIPVSSGWNHLVINHDRAFFLLPRAQSLQYWDTNSGKTNATYFTASRPLSCLSASSRGILACGDSSGAVQLWNSDTGEKGRLIKAHDSEVLSLAFAPDGRRLASGVSDGEVGIWRVDDGEKVASFKTQEPVRALAFGANGDVLAAAVGNTIQLWDVQTRNTVNVLRGHRDIAMSVAFSPDGETLASAGRSDQVILWHWPSGTELAAFQVHFDWVFKVAFSADGKTLLSAGGKIIRIWDVATRQPRFTLKGHGNDVTGIGFLKGERTLVSCSEDGTARLWRAASEKELEAADWWRHAQTGTHDKKRGRRPHCGILPEHNLETRPPSRDIRECSTNGFPD